MCYQKIAALGDDMWVFGYGSLMWDGWYVEFGGGDPVKAKLVGFRRRFNKGSVANWGTKEVPGPTLNIESGAGFMCEGMAFSFSEQRKHDVLSYLIEREGKPFKLEEHRIVLSSGEEATAIVPVYHGKNVLNEPPGKLVELALRARGTSGACVDYVMNIDRELASHGIDDEEVRTFAAMVRERR